MGVVDTIIFWTTFVVAMVVGKIMSMLLRHHIARLNVLSYKYRYKDYHRDLSHEMPFISTKISDFFFYKRSQKQSGLTKVIMIVLTIIFFMNFFTIPITLLYFEKELTALALRPNSLAVSDWHEVRTPYIAITGVFLSSLILPLLAYEALRKLWPFLRAYDPWYLRVPKNMAGEGLYEVTRDIIVHYVRAGKFTVYNDMSTISFSRQLGDVRAKEFWRKVMVFMVPIMIFSFIDNSAFTRISDQHIQYRSFLSQSDHLVSMTDIVSISRACDVKAYKGKLESNVKIVVELSNGKSLSILQGRTNTKAQIRAVKSIYSGSKAKRLPVIYKSEDDKLSNFKSCYKHLLYPLSGVDVAEWLK